MYSWLVASILLIVDCQQCLVVGFFTDMMACPKPGNGSPTLSGGSWMGMSGLWWSHFSSEFTDPHESRWKIHRRNSQLTSMASASRGPFQGKCLKSHCWWLTKTAGSSRGHQPHQVFPHLTGYPRPQAAPWTASPTPASMTPSWWSSVATADGSGPINEARAERWGSQSMANSSCELYRSTVMVNRC